jgi:hypothetical protein
MDQDARGGRVQKTRAQAPKLEPLWERLQQSIDWYDGKVAVKRLEVSEDAEVKIVEILARAAQEIRGA